MRTKVKWKWAGGLCFLIFCLLAIGLFFAASGNGAATAYAATSRSAVCTTKGKIENQNGGILRDAPTANYTITMESLDASGTGTLENNAVIDWTYVTFIINVTSVDEHASYTLSRDGVNIAGGDLSGKSSMTICSASLTDGNYVFTYVGTYTVKRVATYVNARYVYRFTVDNTAPVCELKAGDGLISSGDNTAKSITFSAEDKHFDRIYYKSPSASSFSSTTKTSYTVDAKASNSGWWSFYASDSLGQRSETVKAYLDCMPPKMKLSNGISFGSTVGQSFTVTASDEVSSSKLYVKYESEEWFSSGNSYTVPNTERNGRYYFYAEDGNGNRSETSWVVLSTEEPVGRIIKSETDNSVAFTWDSDYWSATLDGRPYNKETWIVAEGNHRIVLSNNAEKSKTYTFSIDHCYIAKESKDSNCKENGWVKYECLQCGDTKESVIYAKGHQYSVQKQPATCTSQGRSTYTCTVCGYSYTEEDSGLPTGHSFTSRIKKEPTCTEDGIRENVCDLCGEVTETKINAHGHNYEITDVQSTDGNTRRTYTCSICGDSYTQELGNQYEEVSNYVEYLFEQYRPYMIWVFLATAGVWSIAIGIALIIAHKNEDKEKAKKMLVNYVIGIIVIFAILVAAPFLVRGIAALVT